MSQDSLEISEENTFYSMHEWMVSEDKWCSFCGALLGSWLKCFDLGDRRNFI